MQGKYNYDNLVLIGLYFYKVCSKAGKMINWCNYKMESILLNILFPY